jgi:23S rRNA pseudouridine2605 synthase
MAQERLQKILAQAGIASRRAAEALITQGEVRVNSRVVTELGVRADASRDRIEVNGVRIVAEKPVYYVLNKPREVVTTLKDPEGRPTIADLMKRIPERVFPVGRLDFHTSGVLLLTNDGELAQALLHPTRGVPKAYVVKVRGHVPLPKIEALRNGVVLDDGQKTKPAHLFIVREEKDNTWLQITITEGRNRQIHRMCEAMNLKVMRLSRVAFADVTTEGLRPGDYRELSQKELAKLDKDYRTPATRQRVDQARIRRYAAAGYDFSDIEITRAPRGPRRGAASTLQADAKEAEEAARAKPAPSRGGKRPFGTRTQGRTDAAFGTGRGPAKKGQRGAFQKRADQRSDATKGPAKKDPRDRAKKRGNSRR